MNPEMEPVASSNVAAIGYDESAEEVYVEFLDSGLYAYSGVSLPIFQEFQSASSKGSFVNQILKPGYPYRKV
jgi:CHASE1-domain containing sensor protein